MSHTRKIIVINEQAHLNREQIAYLDEISQDIKPNPNTIFFEDTISGFDYHRVLLAEKEARENHRRDSFVNKPKRWRTK